MSSINTATSEAPNAHVNNVDEASYQGGEAADTDGKISSVRDKCIQTNRSTVRNMGNGVEIEEKIEAVRLQTISSDEVKKRFPNFWKKHCNEQGVRDFSKAEIQDQNADGEKRDWAIIGVHKAYRWRAYAVPNGEEGVEIFKTDRKCKKKLRKCSDMKQKEEFNKKFENYKKELMTGGILTCAK